MLHLHVRTMILYNTNLFFSSDIRFHDLICYLSLIDYECCFIYIVIYKIDKIFIKSIIKIMPWICTYLIMNYVLYD